MTLDLAAGTVLDGKYRIERRLGKGGMGAVYLATHLGTTRPVALKVIVPQLAGNAEFFARFRREAEAAGRLRHPNVVNVTDFGVALRPGAAAGDRDGEIAYLVMEYLGGRTLAQHLAERGQLPLEMVVDVVDQVALALDTAHGLGVVHRDLKPENILLESDRRGGFNVKVLDFGVAKLSDPRDEPLVPVERAVLNDGSLEAGTIALPSAPADDDTDTVVLRAAASPARAAAPPPEPAASTFTPGTTNAYLTSAYHTLAGSLLGTPTYMSPEQCRGEEIDGRSDVYSLAVIAYQMLTGGVPFAGASLPETIRMHLSDAPPPLQAKAPSVAPALAAVVLQSLEKDPARRPAKAGLFAARVRVGAEGEARPLRQSKDIVNNHVGLFLRLTAASMLLPLVALALARLGLIAVAARVDLPPAAVVAAVVVGSAGLVHFGAQLYELLALLALRQFAASGEYRVDARRLAGDALRLFPRVLATKLRGLPRLWPRALIEDQLWPVVVAAEGSSGSAALRRSAELVGAVRPLAQSSLLRHLGPAWIAALMYPALFTLIDTEALLELSRALTTHGTFGWLVTIYPVVLSMLYMAYVPARGLLYWTARQCLGEAEPPDLPEVGRRRGRRPRPALATLAWWGVPLLLAAVAALGLYRLARPPLSDQLEKAIREGRGAGVERLVAQGAPVDGAEIGGATPLMQAVVTGNRRAAELLIARGARLDARDKRQATPLRHAVGRGHADIARLLLERGADPNLADETGATPLMAAALRGDAGLVQALLDRGADPARRDREGHTARDLALQEGHAEVAALLGR